MVRAMRCGWPAVALIMALAIPLGRAQTIVSASAAQGALCRAAVAVAERDNGIPPRLLAAISQAESGRRDPVTGDTYPWPWAVNVGGEGYFYDSKAEAVAAVRGLQARGVRSIDVGCGQINLMHHPDAFRSVDVALDPSANAAYAARFLKQLFVRTGDWTKAAAAYHSATPDLGAEYQRRVLAVWSRERPMTGAAAPTPLAQAWAATMTTPPPGFTRLPRGRPLGAVQGG